MFNSRLKELREGKNLTQEELAKELGLKIDRIRSYEQGKTTPDYGLLIKIADYFNTDIDYLIGRGTEKEQENTGTHKKEIAKRLKELREKKGLKQTDLAEELGWKIAKLRTYEQAQSEPPMEALIELANFFNVDIDYLIGRDRKKIIGTMEDLAILLNDVSEEKREKTLELLKTLLK